MTITLPVSTTAAGRLIARALAEIATEKLNRIGTLNARYTNAAGELLLLVEWEERTGRGWSLYIDASVSYAAAAVAIDRYMA